MTITSGPRRSATRRRLCEAATRLMAEQGFSSTTVEEIAEHAGVAKGTVFDNFANKTAIFEELLRQGVEQLAAALRQAAEETLKDGGSRIDALDAMIRAGLLHIDRHPDFTRLYVAEQWRTNRAWHATLLAVRSRSVSVVEEVLREGIAEGELSGALDVPVTASALVGMVLVAALDWQAFLPEHSLEDVHRTLSLLVRGRLAGSARPA